MTNYPLYQVSVGSVPAKAKRAVDSNKKMFGKDYKLKIIPNEKKCIGDDNKEYITTYTDQEKAILSDLFRYKLAADSPYGFFACLDCRFLKDPRSTFTAPGGSPYLTSWKGHKDQGDSVVLYCNDCQEFFKQGLLKLMNELSGVYGAQMKLLRDIPFHVVDPNLFYHKKIGLYGPVNYTLKSIGEEDGTF